jgi:hypothetical protein
VNKEHIIEHVTSQSFAEDGKEKLNCSDALKIAEQTGVEPSVIGEICNERNIKICQCQLGCFK